MAQLRSVTQKCVNVNPDLLPQVSTLLRNLLQSLTNLDHYEEFLEEINQNSVKHSLEHLSPVGSTRKQLTAAVRRVTQNLYCIYFAD